MRLALALAVVALATVLWLWVLGFVGREEALDGSWRVLALVTSGAGVALALRALLATRGSADGPGTRPPGGGPQF